MMEEKDEKKPADGPLPAGSTVDPAQQRRGIREKPTDPGDDDTSHLSNKRAWRQSTNPFERKRISERPKG